jgi:hypothetical protein
MSSTTWPDSRSVPISSERVSAVELDESTGLYDEASHALAILNPTATAVWRRCDGEKTFDEIVEEIALEYGIGAHFVREDVEQTLRKLAELGLVSDAMS